jgi:hypothetical protein
MKIISKRRAMTIYRQHPESRIFRYCTGKYQWHGSVCHYTGRDVPDITGVLAVRRTPPGPQRTVCLPDEYHPELTIKEVINEQHHMGPAADITPRLGARLVQEGNRLHYLADRASITGKFSDAECRKLDETFPHFISQMESMLTTGELNPRHATASPCTTTVLPAKPIPLAVAATYTSPFIPLSAN